LDINIDFFKRRSGLSNVFNRDHEIATLRKMGFKGTLSDMRQQFYYFVTGNPWLQDAKVKAKGMNEVSSKIDFVGKVKGDTDTTRFAGWTLHPNFPTLAATFNEFMGGYTNAATDNGIPVSYETTGPTGQYICFVFDYDIGKYGSRDTILRNLKSMNMRIKTTESNLYVFNYTNNSFDTELIASTTADGAQLEYIQLDTTSKAEQIISPTNKIRFLLRLKTMLNGTVSKKLQADYVEVNFSFFKSV